MHANRDLMHHPETHKNSAVVYAGSLGRATKMASQTARSSAKDLIWSMNSGWSRQESRRHPTGSLMHCTYLLDSALERL